MQTNSFKMMPNLKVYELKLNQIISVNKFQPDVDESFQELKESVETFGLFFPLIVCDLTVAKILDAKMLGYNFDHNSTISQQSDTVGQAYITEEYYVLLDGEKRLSIYQANIQHDKESSYKQYTSKDSSDQNTHNTQSYTLPAYVIDKEILEQILYRDNLDDSKTEQKKFDILLSIKKMIALINLQAIQQSNMPINTLALAYAYKDLLQFYTQQQIADQIQKSRAHVANIVRLLKLPIYVQCMLNKQEISVGQAVELLNIFKNMPDADVNKYKKPYIEEIESLISSQASVHSMRKAKHAIQHSLLDLVDAKLLEEQIENAFRVDQNSTDRDSKKIDIKKIDSNNGDDKKSQSVKTSQSVKKAQLGMRMKSIIKVQVLPDGIKLCFKTAKALDAVLERLMRKR